MRSLRFVFALAAAAFIVPTGITSAAEFEITCQSPYVAPHVTSQKTLPRFIEEVEKNAQGKLEITLLMADTIVKETDATVAVHEGGLDMGGVRINGLHDHLYPRALELCIPFLFNDVNHASRGFRYAYNNIPEIKKELDGIGKLIGMIPSKKYAFFSKDKPILSPADIKGKRVICDSPTQMEVVKAWGGIPVQLNIGDIYIAMERGAGDITWGGIPFVGTLKLGEICKYVTEFPYVYIPTTIMMNWDVWNDLSPEVQEAINKYSLDKFCDEAAQDMIDMAGAYIEASKAAGCQYFTLTPEQNAEFQKLAAPAIAKTWKDNMDRLGITDQDTWVNALKAAAEATK